METSYSFYCKFGIKHREKKIFSKISVFFCESYFLYIIDLIFSKEVFLVACPNNKRDKPTPEKLIVDRVTYWFVFWVAKFVKSRWKKEASS